MRLLVGDHLHAMLEASQEVIGALQLGADLRLDPAALDQPLQRDECFAFAQILLTSAGDQLLGLDEELDLANAAAAELDVVAGDADAAEAAEGMDLALHGVDVGDGGEVEIAAPDERRQFLEEAPHRPRCRQRTQRALISAARSQFWPKLS